MTILNDAEQCWLYGRWQAFHIFYTVMCISLAASKLYSNCLKFVTEGRASS